jgi:hypothetical protein
LPRELEKSLHSPEVKKKYQPQSTQRPQSFFLVKTKSKNQKSFYFYRLLFAFRSSGIEDKRMNEEETESAEERNWNTGILEYWVLGVHFPTHYSIIPSFHYSFS